MAKDRVPGERKASESGKVVRIAPRGLDKRGRLKAGPGVARGNVEVQTWNEIDANGEFTGYTEQRERIVPPPERRCKAVINNLEWAGNQCCRYTILGANVCASHGGGLPEVKKAAKQRLALAADRASAKLIHIALHKRGVADRDRIRAISEILDRAGIQGKQTIEVEVKPWQAMLQRISGKLDGNTDTLEAQEGVDFYILEESDDEDDDDD
jgi:hypothetical protein